MACIHNKGTRARPNWFVKWRDPEGHQRNRRVGEDRELALRIARKVESELVEGRYGVAHPKPVVFPTLAKAADAWIERRKAPNKDGMPMVRSWRDDRTRLTKYIVPFAGSKRLDELQDPGWLKAFIEHVRPQLAPQSIRNCLNIVSRLFQDHIEDGLPLANPARKLDRATRRHVGPKWDPTKARFIDTKGDIHALYFAFPPMGRSAPWRAMFGVGVFAGLRPSEVRALEWADIDFENRLIHVRRQTSGPLKDNECRSVPLLDALGPILAEWRRHAPVGSKLCFPARGHGPGTYIEKHALGMALHAAQAKLAKPGPRPVDRVQPRLNWYACTRHTFASHWVMDGGSLEKLRHILGHSSFMVTQRYAHLAPGRFTDEERALVGVQLAEAQVIPMKKASERMPGSSE